VRRNAAEREAIDRIVFDELIYGVSTMDAVAGFQQVIGRIRMQAATP
jgi:hypothetical protein